MKSYTDLEQSKKLAEILPIESADMNYWCGTQIRIGGHRTMDKDLDVPCWSLATLLDAFKYPLLTQDVENKWSITDWTRAYPKSEHGFDNPVDACYELILKLHELNLL